MRDRPDAKAERFLDLLEPHQRRLRAIGRGLSRRKADADDVLQEAILAAWRDFPRYREIDRFGAWILRYLVNAVRNRNRRLHLALEVPVPDEIESADRALADELSYESFLQSPESVLDSLDEKLAGAIRALPPAERAVLLLRTVGELSYREISRALDMPEGTAMSHLSRARKRLRSVLSHPFAERASPGGKRGDEGPGGGAP